MAEVSPGPIEPLHLYLLRHADAGDPMAWSGDDADRPLSPKGKRAQIWSRPRPCPSFGTGISPIPPRFCG